MSGVEAAVHCGDELWFVVGVRAGSEFGYTYGEKWTQSSIGIELPLSADLNYIEYAHSDSKTVLPRMFRDLR